MPTPLRHSHRLSTKEQAKLRQMIRIMSRDSSLYRLLRDELKTRGNWKQAPRGKPSAAHLAPYAKRSAQTYEPLSD